ncbi:hypothetical protein E2C01_025721 [Portunus trituberculatus]|uniref:Uncharacterized protein n=1 Tax=Portunus trituberculatus TaxID=210409 RepID=A0A5B7EE06_PORTR|nr:hypothetical protein [Portunus trituberculatus]
MIAESKHYVITFANRRLIKNSCNRRAHAMQWNSTTTTTTTTTTTINITTTTTTTTTITTTTTTITTTTITTTTATTTHNTRGFPHLSSHRLTPCPFRTPA